MHEAGSLIWIIIFSLMLLSHLYKEFSCETIVKQIGNGHKHIFEEQQLPDMTTGDTEQDILIVPGLGQEIFPKILIPGQDTITRKSEREVEDGPESNEQSISAMFELSREKFMRDLASERKRRESADQRTECQRHQMNVSFKDLGWDSFIIAPSGYNAYYCDGECPYQLANFNSTKHAQIQSMMSIGDSKIPKPCCVPTELSSLQLIYYVDSNAINEHWTEMIVEACGCR
ncbi:hypothetical protein ACJMK2_000483 [Sinanodonta woodiana]|uniref:TGF-beta family profile domain-containing protein n=1 Tax=Sinanodonta woodiana TaxID=1069815 RepID=A0ABD3XPW7_SINWO